ncbi:MAG: PorP/SprF family type IX secretion system membrane protein [Bacteroidales bacterium]|nr:PorP/SprF family type IX secretion system membrane protein [Bacteroidales bacterium]
MLTIFFVLLLFSSNYAGAQDIHFSQIDLNPVLFNPAYAGFFEGQARFGLAYRNQWASVSKPYQTFAATAEASLMRNRYNFNGLNAGLMVFRDRAGSLNYGSTAANVMVSYYQSPTASTNNYLSVSLEAGYGQAGFDGDAADLMDSREIFEKDRCNYFTLGAGAAWFYQPSEDLVVRVALSARNLNRPHVSYLGNDSSRVSTKWNLYGRTEWRFSHNLSLIPLFAAQVQRKYHEVYFGTDLKWYLSEKQDLIAVWGGVCMRYADAMIFTVGAEYNAFVLAISYDSNMSKLVAASHSMGAFEIGLVYRLVPIHKRPGSLPCPIM